MRIIDLLNKKANDEKLPYKIKFDDIVWCKLNWKNCTSYIDKNKNDLFIYIFKHNLTFTLNDKVEIIDDISKENKLPKRIESNGENLYSEYIGQWLVNKENYTEYDELLMNKINEIIDYLKSKEMNK